MAEKRDRVDPEKLRKNLLDLADVIRKLDESGTLLESSPKLIRLMGNLRSELFEYEVRCTGRLLPKGKEPPEVREAQRIVEEAARQFEEEKRSWESQWSLDSEEDEDS